MKKVIALVTAALLAFSAPAASPKSKVAKPSARAVELAEPENRLKLYALDATVPGYAAFSFGDYLAGSLFVAGRAATLILGLRARKQQLEYRSVEKAARTAQFVYGPGLRFQDPFSGGFRTADELRRTADRRAAIVSLSLTLHLALVIGSLVYTGIRAGEINATTLPVFNMSTGESSRNRAPAFALEHEPSPVDVNRNESDLRLHFELIRRDF